MKIQLKALKEIKFNHGTIQGGEVFKVSKEQGIRLIELGYAIPTGDVAYKIYSRVLDDVIHIVNDGAHFNPDDDHAVYTCSELSGLVGKPERVIRLSHTAKKMFKGKILSITKREGGKK